MAIITEEPEQEPQQPIQKPKTNPTSTTKPQNNTNPFTFWFYFTLSVSLVTLIFISLSSLSSSQDPKQWFLSLPSSLRRHYSSGRIIKVQMSPNRAPIELFTFQNGVKSTENVLIVHGLGVSSFSFRGMVESLGSRGVRVIAVDLPGSGFSDRSTMEVAERSDGSLQRLRDVYGLIQEKGIFWAFDQIVETGQIPYEEIMKSRVLERKSVKSIELGSEELGRVLVQVIQTMNLAPVHLVLHDSALLMSANWVVENSGLVKNITLVDTKLKDFEHPRTDGGMRPSHRKRKTYYNHEKCHRDVLYKRRRFYDQSSVETFDGGFSCESVTNSLEKGKNIDKSISRSMLQANGMTSSVKGHQSSLRSKDSNVKFNIKSFKVLEIFIEVLETATVSSLKRTVMDAVTAILGGWIRVGVLMHGKKVRDDNRTLSQTSLASKDNLDTLGFTLDPSSVEAPAPPFVCPEDPPLLLSDAPQLVARRSVLSMTLN